MNFSSYILITAISMSACGQSKSIAKNTNSKLIVNDLQIKNGYAYSRARIAGTIAVDENGNELSKGVDTTYTIYLETVGSISPTINTAWVNGRPYNAPIVPLTEKVVQVGVTSAGKAILINTTAGNKLWRIDLTDHLQNKSLTFKTTGAGTNGGINQIVLEGIINNKKFTHSILAITELPRMNGL